MDDKGTKIYADIVAKQVGAFLHCYKPEVLDMLKISCPVTCKTCWNDCFYTDSLLIQYYDDNQYIKIRFDNNFTKNSDGIGVKPWGWRKYE